MDTQSAKKSEIVINIKDFINQLWIYKSFIIRTTAAFFIAGLIIAFSIPKEFSCSVKMAPEGSRSTINSSMTDLAAMAGFDVGLGESEAINMTLYPDVINSIPFITEMIMIPVNNSTGDPSKSLYNYLDKDLRKPWWQYIISVPVEMIGTILNHHDNKWDNKIDPYNLSRKQELIINTLKERLSVEVDKRKSIILVNVTMQDPKVAAIIADSLVSKLEKYIILYRTNKARHDYDFTRKMFEDTKVAYYNAQQNYARFVDANKNVVLRSVLIEEDRLKNEQMLAFNVYSNLAQQTNAKKMKIQEQTPCVTIIEPARIPSGRSNMGRMSILLASIIIGFISGFGYIFFRKIAIKRPVINS
jgi:uncharacterized protein involved in exopolysaccharide biosynthesis